MNGRFAAFDGFVFDRQRRTLSCGDERIALMPKSLEIVAFLIERAGDTVSKEELLEALWPGEYVQESNLSQQMYLLRKSLAPFGAGELVQTVPRRGYRFAADVTVLDDLPGEHPGDDGFPIVMPAAGLPAAPRHWTSVFRLHPRAFAAAAAFAAAIAALGVGLVRNPAHTNTALAALDPTAANEYRLGRYYFDKRSPADLRRSIDEFESVIKREPKNPLGYSGLADAQAQLSRLTLGPDVVKLNQAALANAQTAVQYGTDSAEAHATYAYQLGNNSNRQPDMEAATNEFQKAIALDPSYVNAHHWYGIMSIDNGDFTTAIRELRIATQLDPTSVPSARWLGFAYYYGHRYDEAVTQLRKALELDPQNGDAQLHLALALEQRGDIAEATKVLAQLPARYDRGEIDAWLAYAHALGGRRALAQREIEGVIYSAHRRNVGGASIAAVFAALGQQREASEWLRLAKDVSDSSSLFPRFDPRIASIYRPANDN